MRLVSVGSAQFDAIYSWRIVFLMKARYLSICHNCSKSIELGDTIRSEYDNSSEYWRAVHDDCRRPTEEVTDGEWKEREAQEDVGYA